jgi:hypothetical protein
MITISITSPSITNFSMLVPSITTLSITPLSTISLIIHEDMHNNVYSA